MILIDAIFINNGGGKILLDYLYKVLNKEISTDIVMLIDDRIKSEYELKKSTHITFVFLKGFSERNKYYREYGGQYSKVLCFGNIPPNIRLKAKVFTYFHQLMYLKIPNEFGVVDKITFKIKILILKRFSKNSDFWLVQSQLIKNELTKKFTLTPERIIKLAFYPPFKNKQKYKREDNSFIFISNANPHKNHEKLIESFCRHYDKFKNGKLTLTVNNSFREVYKLIEKKISEGYPIINLGFIDREDLYQYYQTHEYLIFPSLAESYGLGIIESIENGCKVIGADLPYMHEICEPSIVFDPTNLESTENAFYVATHKLDIPVSIIKTGNQINELLQILKK